MEEDKPTFEDHGDALRILTHARHVRFIHQSVALCFDPSNALKEGLLVTLSFFESVPGSAC